MSKPPPFFFAVCAFFLSFCSALGLFSASLLCFASLSACFVFLCCHVMFLCSDAKGCLCSINIILILFLLSAGFITGNRVRCPWHGSCFNLLTGDLEEYPGMDCLPCHKVQTKKSGRQTFTSGGRFSVILICLYTFFKVRIQNSKVYVSINKKVSRSTIHFQSMFLLLLLVKLSWSMWKVQSHCLFE